MKKNTVNRSEFSSNIRKNVLLKNMDDDFMTELLKHLILHQFQHDSVIFKQGDVTDGLYFVIKGCVKLYTMRNNNTFTISHAPENTLFGEFPFLGNSNRAFNAIVSEDVTLLYLPIEYFNNLSKQYPEQAQIIKQRLLKRLSWYRIALAVQLNKIFMNHDENFIRALIHELELHFVSSNTLLVKQNDISKELYIVVDGRFQISINNSDGIPEVLGFVARGDTIGEIGIICDSPRMADVTAIRDSSVARLTVAAYEKLLKKYPLNINHTFVKSIVNHLVKNNKQQTASAETFVLVSLSPDISTIEIAQYLEKSFEPFGSTLIISSQSCDQAFNQIGFSQTDFNDSANDSLLQWINESELTYRHVIFVTDPIFNNWTRRCLRQADHINFIALHSHHSAVQLFEQQILQEKAIRNAKKTLLLMHSATVQVPSGSSEWLKNRDLSMHHHVRLGHHEDFGRVARFLTGNAIGLVLGGGGARGFAHVGIIRALNELKIPIDFVGGNSMGAIIAAQCALQWDCQDMIKRTQQFCLGGDELTLPVLSIFTGRKLASGFRKMFGDTDIQDLWRRFYSVSCNISRATVMLHDKGLLSTAVLTSNTPPGLAPPQVINGDLLVDGALLNNLPVDIMKQYNEGGTIIAVDVSAREDLLNNADLSGGISGWRILANKLNPFTPKINIPNIVEILARASIMGSLAQRKKIMNGIADIYLQPPINNFSLMDYDQGEKIAETGYQYALTILRDWQQNKLDLNQPQAPDAEDSQR